MAKISWQVLSNKKILINNESTSASIDDITITYHDEYGMHIINKIDKTYERIGKEDIMKIDFKNQLLTIKFDQQKLDYDIFAKYIESKDKIILRYNFGDEEKEIIIKRIDK